MNPAANVGYAAVDPLGGAAKALPMYPPVSTGVWNPPPGMMNEQNMYTQSARYPMAQQESYNNMMMPPMSTANMMTAAALNPQMLAMMNAQQCPPMNSVLMNLDLPASNFNKAVNFSKMNDGAAGPEHDLNHNGYSGAYGSIPDQRHLEADNSLAEQSQSREQAQLLEQFKQLRQWQQQQQQMLLQQQQAQLLKLQEEQHMIQKMISKQRQAQWGGGPPQSGYAPNESAMEGYGSPKKTTKPMSSIPQALAHGAMAMAHMDPMHGQMPVMQGPGQGGYPMHPSDNMQHLDHHADEDADSTIIESASLYADNDGVAPLPGSETWHAQQKLQQQKTLQKSQVRQAAPRDSDEYESEDEVKSNASEMNMEARDDESDFQDNQNEEEQNLENYEDYDHDYDQYYDQDCDQDRTNLDSDEEGKPFTKPKLLRHKDDNCDTRYKDDHLAGHESEGDNDQLNKEDSFEAAGPPEEPTPDEQPIVSRHKTFEALLEEELQKEREMQIQEEENKKQASKRKLPFLKKGQGIARFGLFKSLRKSFRGAKGSTKNTPTASTPARPKSESQSKKNDTSKPVKESAISSMGARLFGKSSQPKLKASKSVSETVLNAKPSNLLPSSKSSSQILAAAQPESLSQLPPTASGSKSLRGTPDRKSVGEKSSTVLSQSGNTSFLRKKKEQDELEEFEILEEFADDNASFLSNMSAVNRAVLTKKTERSSKPTTPVTNIATATSIKDDKPADAAEKQEETDEDVEDLQSDELSNSEDEESEGENVRSKGRGKKKKEEEEEGGNSDCDDTMRQEDYSEDESEDELTSSRNSRHFRSDLPRKLASLNNPSKTATANASSKFDPTAQLSKVMHWSGSESEGHEGDNVHKTNSDSYNSSESQATPNGDNIDFGDDEEWGEPDTPVKQVSGAVPGRSAITKTKVSPVNISRPGYDSPPPTSQLVNKLFPSLKQEQAKLQQKKQEEMAEKLEATKQAGAANDGVQSKLIRDKLMQLENEIEKFKSENAALNKLRKEREEGLQELKKEMTEFEKQKDEELKRLQEFKAEETKKLKREKKQFEEYKKAMKTLPDKKEREEIETLKKQVTDLQEEMKRKESRWTSSNTRLRNRVEELETENQELKEEIRLMEKRHLEQWQQGSGNKSNIHSKPLAKHPQTSPMPESKPDQYDSQDNNALRLSNNMDQDSQADDTMSDISDSSHLTTPSEAAAVRATMPPAPSSFPAASGAAQGFQQPTAMRTAAPQPFAQPDAAITSPALRRSSEGHLPSMAAAAASASPSVLSDGEGSRKGVQRKRAMPISISNTIDKGDEEYSEVTHADGKVEKLYNNGAREILFANGTRKQVSSDGQSIIVSFFNGDIKQILADQRVIYYYAEGQTTHTTYPDSLEILQFPNGQIEKHYPDGTKEITFPDQTMKYLFPNGSEESIFPDGMVIRQESNGEKVMEFPNGQREIHTTQYKRREYPDGTVKTVYPDGRHETRYSSGRLRVKDKNGSVLVDKRI